MTSAAPSRALATVLFLGTLVAALDIALIGPTLRAIEEAFAISSRQSGWVLSAFVLANLIGLPFTAWMGDAWGRRSVFAGCLLVFVTGTALVALAPTYGWLITARVVQGLGASGLFPMASAVVGDAFPPDRRGRVLGLLGAVFGIAFLIGPVVAGILVGFGWRWVFLVNVPLALGVLVGALRVLPRSRPAQTRPLDWRGALLLGLGLLLLALSANQVRASAALLTTTALGLLAASALAFAAFGWVERRVRSPLVRPMLLQQRQVRLAAVFCVVAGLAEALIVFLPPYAQSAFAVTRPQAAYMLLPLTLAITVGAPVAGRLLDRIGSRHVLLGGSLLLTGGLLVLATGPTALVTYYAGTVVMGLGLSGMLGSSLSYILLNESAAHERTVAQGFVTLFLSTGQIVGGALIGALVAGPSGALGGYRTAFAVVAGCAVVLVGASFALKRRHEERAL